MDGLVYHYWYWYWYWYERRFPTNKFSASAMSWKPLWVNWDSNVTFSNLGINLKLLFNFLHRCRLNSNFMKYLLQKNCPRQIFLGKYVCCSYFVLELGNRSLSQLMTVYPALPRQPAGDLFYGQGLRKEKNIKILPMV